MRCFITLEFNKETKEKIAEVQKVIRNNSKKGRFKYIDNFHITLKFLGEIDEQKINDIYNDLLLELKNFKSFALNLNGIGAFGISNFIKTIYIKLTGQIQVLNKLAFIVDKVTTKYGFKQEHKYTPHITVAQDVELNISFNELEKILNKEFCKCVIFDKVVIMKSEQVFNKRVYTPLKIINLG
jgi:2'-5' RNA ligase